MAKETTDVFDVVVKFASTSDKLEHMLRLFNKKMVVDQLDSWDLGDTFKIDLSFKDPKDKWNDFFGKGEWMKSYKITSHKSTPLTDEFTIEAKYKGRIKDFKKSFHSTGYNKFEVVATLVSSKTASLGVLNPYGKQVTKSQKEVLEIFKVYFTDVLKKAGFIKKSTIPTAASSKMDFQISVIGGATYHGMWNERLVCVHLASGWKVGILPKTGDEERFKVVISKPGVTYHRNKNPSYTVVLRDLGIPDRVTEKVDPNRTYYKMKVYKELFLGDPGIEKTMADFFKYLNQTPPTDAIR
jgi:hypothetical protein